MRVRTGLAALLLVASSVSAWATDEAPLTLAEAADLAVAAAGRGDAAALAALAQRTDPDAWALADALEARGDTKALAAFAKAARGPATAKLAAYAAKVRDPKVLQGTRAAISEAASRLSGDEGARTEALALLDGLKPDTSTIPGIRAVLARGFALAALGKTVEAIAAVDQASGAAEALGWLSGAADDALAAAAMAAKAPDPEGAVARYERAAQLSASAGRGTRAAQALRDLGNFLRGASRSTEARKAFERAVAAASSAKDAATRALALADLGRALSDEGKFMAAANALRAAAKSFADRGDAANGAAARADLGDALVDLGEPEEAVPVLMEAAEAARGVGAARVEARARVSLGKALAVLGRTDEGVAEVERALDVSRTAGNRTGELSAQNALGTLLAGAGRPKDALRVRQEALTTARALGNRRFLGTCLMNLALTQVSLGQTAQALENLDQALDLAREAGDVHGEVKVLLNRSGIWSGLGDGARAIAEEEQAVALLRRLEDPPTLGAALSNLALHHVEAGAPAKGVAAGEEACRIFEAAKDRRGLATAQHVLGMAVEDTGDAEKALGLQRKASAVLRELGAASELVASLTCIAVLEGKLGSPAASLAGFEEALVIQRPLGDPSRLVTLLTNVAAVALKSGDPEKAIRSAREAAENVPLVVAGLPDEQAARARSQWTDVYAAGLLGALRVKRPDEAWYFLESGRAGALLSVLENRGALRDAVVPEALRRQDDAARAEEARAAKAVRGAFASGDTAGVMARTRAWDTARVARAEVADRIRRAAGATTDALYPKPSTLAEVQAALAPDQALLSYSWGAEHAVCLVVTPRSALPVDLGPAAEIEALCGSVAAAKEGRIPADTLARLKALLVDALRLPAGTRRLLVSPHGALAYAPFALLSPDRETVLVPSGTTWMLLRADAAHRGAKVLALGDPAYGTTSSAPDAARLRSGFTLSPLPATRDEAKAVGSEVLLGADASEARLRKSLAGTPRWRAVHFACHGLVDPERPMLSALALSPSEADDGFLTAREILSLRVPADLVVLSACETGRGRAYAAEGIVGLTRAFMFAGAPRVVVSLWKVDDRATNLLMTRFYKALQGKDVRAATALRRAQEEVRTFEQEAVDVEASRAAGRDVHVKRRPFEDPAAWAGWALWGLPD